MNSGIDMSYKQWENLKDSVQTSLHWATPKNERMLPEGEETCQNETVLINNEDADNTKSERKAPLLRQDSCHPTIVMINKQQQQDLRKKFRNYEI